MASVEYNKEYHLRNKDKRLQQMRDSYLKNKEYRLKLAKERYEKLKHELAELRSAFDLTSDEQIRNCWKLDNLQPLWMSENRSKYNKVEEKKCI